MRLFRVDSGFVVKQIIELGSCRLRDVVQVVLGAPEVEVAQLLFGMF